MNVIKESLFSHRTPIYIKNIHKILSKSILITVLIAMHLLFAAQLFSKDILNKDFKSKLLTGTEFYMNYQFDEADSFFKVLESENLGDPIPQFYILMNRYAKRRASGEFDKGADELFDHIPSVLDAYDDWLDMNENDVARLVYYGTTLALRSRVYMSRSKYVKAFWGGYKAINSVEKANELEPRYYDAYLAMGTYDFFGSLVAEHFSIVDALIDRKVKRKSGLARLELAWNKGGESKYEAAGLLSMINLYEVEDLEKALFYTGTLVEKFPGNLEFLSLNIEGLFYSREFEKGGQKLNFLKTKIPQNNISGKKMWTVRYEYLKGVELMEKGLYAEARSHFDYTIEHYNLEFKWQYALSYLKLGQMADIENDREKALYYYTKAVDTNEITKAVLKAKNYINQAYTL